MHGVMSCIVVCRWCRYDWQSLKDEHFEFSLSGFSAFATFPVARMMWVGPRKPVVSTSLIRQMM